MRMGVIKSLPVNYDTEGILLFFLANAPRLTKIAWEMGALSSTQA